MEEAIKDLQDKIIDIKNEIELDNSGGINYDNKTKDIKYLYSSTSEPSATR
jgi:hypothetical protein